MKKHSLRSLLLLLTGALTLATGPQLATAATQETGIQSDLRTAPFERREEFILVFKESAARLERRIAELDAAQVGKLSSETRTRAQEELKAARTNLDDKIGAFTNASAETWNTVRDNALAALTRVQDAYEALQAL